MTQSTTSSPTPRQAADPPIEEEVATACGIKDWAGFVAEVQEVRRQLRAPTTRWAGQCLAAALQLATRGRGWPTAQAAQALRRVAGDPTTRSPMRVAEAGPWWDETPQSDDPLDHDQDLQALELALLESGGIRIELQLQARCAVVTDKAA